MRFAGGMIGSEAGLEMGFYEITSAVVWSRAAAGGCHPHVQPEEIKRTVHLTHVLIVHQKQSRGRREFNLCVC